MLEMATGSFNQEQQASGLFLSESLPLSLLSPSLSLPLLSPSLSLSLTNE